MPEALPGMTPPSRALNGLKGRREIAPRLGNSFSLILMSPSLPQAVPFLSLSLTHLMSQPNPSSLSVFPRSLLWANGTIPRSPASNLWTKLTSVASRQSQTFGPCHSPLFLSSSPTSSWLPHLLQGSASKRAPLPYPCLLSILSQKLPSALRPVPTQLFPAHVSTYIFF